MNDLNKFKNVTGGQAFSTTNNINIVYITKDILDNKKILLKQSMSKMEQ